MEIAYFQFFRHASCSPGTSIPKVAGLRSGSFQVFFLISLVALTQPVSGFLTRVAVPLRLNYPGTHVPEGIIAGSYLPRPTNIRDLESRRRMWWMAILFDRTVSIGGWLHGIDVQDIGTELPLRAIDFAMEVKCRRIRWAWD